LLRRVGAATAIATAVVLALAGVRSDPVGAAQMALALLLTATGVAMLRARAASDVEVGIDNDGRLSARGREAALTGSAVCVFAAPWLITLKSGTMWIPIWPDSVPATTFRRLWIHIRWSAGRVAASASAAEGRRPQ
jgi:hypothetical protein